MPRIRTIKPEFWDRTGDLTEATALLYIALWNFADDYGVVELDSSLLKARVYSRRPEKTDAILRDHIRELTVTGHIYPYNANNCFYGWIPTFSIHQKINRASTRKYPAPPQELVQKWQNERRTFYGDISELIDFYGEKLPCMKINTVQNDSTISSHGALTEDSSLEQGTGIKEQGEDNTHPQSDSIQIKKKHGEFVELSDKEYDKLIESFGNTSVEKAIQQMDAYIGANEKRWSSDYYRLITWVRENNEKKQETVKDDELPVI